MVMRRALDYDQVLERLRGKRVAIWTCDTCARLCNGIGGRVAAERMADRLREDGVDVTGVLHTSASCIVSKVESKYDPSVVDACDVILCLVCNVGTLCVRQTFGKEVLNPIDTLGPGYLDANLVPVLQDGSVVMMRCDPFV